MGVCRKRLFVLWHETLNKSAESDSQRYRQPFVFYSLALNISTKGAPRWAAACAGRYGLSVGRKILVPCKPEGWMGFYWANFKAGRAMTNATDGKRSNEQKSSDRDMDHTWS